MRNLLPTIGQAVTALGHECAEHPLRVAKIVFVMLTIAGAEILMDYAGIFVALFWMIYLPTDA